jgi:predicted nucleotidyltransferase
MRLDESTRQRIKHEVAQLFGEGAKVRLFGSRADDTSRGGDIDLLIDPTQPVPNAVLAECTLASRLYIALGGRKVDVLINDGEIANSPVVREAMKHGVLL